MEEVDKFYVIATDAREKIDQVASSAIVHHMLCMSVAIRSCFKSFVFTSGEQCKTIYLILFSKHPLQTTRWIYMIDMQT